MNPPDKLRLARSILLQTIAGMAIAAAFLLLLGGIIRLIVLLLVSVGLVAHA